MQLISVSTTQTQIKNSSIIDINVTLKGLLVEHIFGRRSSTFFNLNTSRNTMNKYLLLAGIVATSQWAMAQDSIDHEKSIACSACHGTNGISVADNIPNLAGQKSQYLSAQLSAFKDGSRKNVMMNAIAEHLTDDDISELTEFFSTLPVEAESKTGDFSKVTLDQTKVKFPTDYLEKFTHYTTSNRSDVKQVRYTYSNDIAMQGAKDGDTLPNGSVIIMVVHKAKLDSNEEPIMGDDGFFEEDSLVGYGVMEKAAGWGDDIPDSLRNSDWNYAFFTTEQKHKDGINQASCLACHRPLADGDFMFSADALRTAAAK